MFAVIYTFKVKKGLILDFIKHWEDLTDLIYKYEGSLGSRLHQLDDHTYMGYGQWPSKDVWQKSGKNIPAEVTGIRLAMKDCCDFVTTSYEHDIISDKLSLEPYHERNDKPRVTGIGGVFFKSKNVSELKQWYTDNLGLVTDQYGSSFEFRNTHNPDERNYLQWSLFKADSDYFEPAQKDFMINYRVDGLEALVEELKANKVTICDKMETFDYGKFIHILDPEGNKIELWEPVDQVFTIQLNGNTTK